MNLSSWIMIIKTYNCLLLILACQCRSNLILANRFATHRTRLLDTEQVFNKDRSKTIYGYNNNHNNNNNNNDHHHQLYHESLLSSASDSHHINNGNQQKKFFTILNHNQDNNENINNNDGGNDNFYYNNNNNNFDNELGNVCIAPDQRYGTCYDASICAERGGIPMGRCGNNKKNNGGHVCCLFDVTCSQTIRERHVYFRNPNYPYAYNGQRICRSKIKKLDKINNNNICQLKLTFNQFDIAKPIEGNCTQDTFLISGQNENNIIPRICGHNNGQHYYIGVDESGMITLHMVFRGDYPRKFDIHIEQIECGSRKSAPSHCLQYYEGTQGTIKSFNYDTDEQQQQQFQLNNRNDIINVLNEGYPNNIDYMICIRKETGFCSISYEFMSDSSGAVFPFSVGLSTNQFSKRIGLNDGLGRWSGKMYSTVQTTQCDDDYLIVSGTKVCSKIIDSTIKDDNDGDDDLLKKEKTIEPTVSSTIEDLITPGNISENRPSSLTSLNNGKHEINEHNTNNNNGDLLEHLSTENLSDDVEELHNHPLHHHQLNRRQRQIELFNDILTKRYRWMMSASPMLLKKDSLKRLHQNYLMTTDSTPGPFQLRFVSNSVNNAKGFYLAYRQNPCKM